jgi:hypothetical protein
MHVNEKYTVQAILVLFIMCFHIINYSSYIYDLFNTRILKFETDYAPTNAFLLWRYAKTLSKNIILLLKLN